MLLILSAFAMGACQECDDNNVLLGLLSYKNITILPDSVSTCQ